jgi:hypothetical protein
VLTRVSRGVRRSHARPVRSQGREVCSVRVHTPAPPEKERDAARPVTGSHAVATWRQGRRTGRSRPRGAGAWSGAEPNPGCDRGSKSKSPAAERNLAPGSPHCHGIGIARHPLGRSRAVLQQVCSLALGRTRAPAATIILSRNGNEQAATGPAARSGHFGGGRPQTTRNVRPPRRFPFPAGARQ